MDANLLLSFVLGSALLTHGHDCCFYDDDDASREEAYAACVDDLSQPLAVCGADGRSYASDCDAEFAGVDTVADGPCRDDFEPPVSFTAD